MTHDIRRAHSFSCNSDHRLDLKASPPLNGTLDLHLSVGTPRLECDPMCARLTFSNLATFLSGLKFRSLKLSGCIDSNLQLLVDACVYLGGEPAALGGEGKVKELAEESFPLTRKNGRVVVEMPPPRIVDRRSELDVGFHLRCSCLCHKKSTYASGRAFRQGTMQDL